MKRIALFLLAAAIGLQPAIALAELKLGFINSDVFKEQLPEIKEAQRQMEQLAQQRHKEMDERQSTLAQMEENYRKQELLMSEAKKAELQQEYETKAQEAQEFYQNTFGPEGELAKKNFDLNTPIFEKINTTLKALAEEQGYDFIFDAGSASGAIVYAAEKHDLTQQLLQKLQAAAPKAPAPAPAQN